MEYAWRRERKELQHNAKVKAYPDGAQQLLCCDRSIFHAPGWEPSKDKQRPQKAEKKSAQDKGDHQAPENQPQTQESLERAMRRARTQVRDLALCTPFRYFVTLTLDQAKVNRYDMAAITRKLNRWLDNQVRRKGLAYVLVPERHKDGAVHFHGFFNEALDVVDSGTITHKKLRKPRKPRSAAQRAQWLQDGGQVVYNLPGWTLGFTTAIELHGDYRKAVSYVCKYIGKGGAKIGGRWYYSGGRLGHPKVDYLDADFRDLEQDKRTHRFDLEQARLSFVLLDIQSDSTYNCSEYMQLCRDFMEKCQKDNAPLHKTIPKKPDSTPQVGEAYEQLSLALPGEKRRCLSYDEA